MSATPGSNSAKVLLVGPIPPPHGGVAVHLASLRGHLEARGARCEAFDPSAPGNATRPALVQVASIARTIRRFARRGWTIHVHTNGHNLRSWLLALVCGIAARGGPGRLLTLHSGILPDYLDDVHPWRRRLARTVCRLYDRTIAVNRRIGDSLTAAGVRQDHVRIIPAWTGIETPTESVPEGIERWMGLHDPIVASTLAFRPEYRFGWQLAALVALQAEHPNMGLVVMGGGENAEAARRQIHQQDLEGDVLLLGDIPHERCLAVLSRCDLFLRTTSHDGDALSVREALALDVPVVASDVGFRPEGTRLFPVDDFRALLRQARAALADGDGSEPSAAAAPAIAPGEIERLLRTYREIAAPRLRPGRLEAVGAHGMARGGHR